MTAPTTVAVLGAAGCLGRAIATALRERGDKVVGITRRATDTDPGLVRLDLTTCHPAELAAVLAEHRVDVVINATAGWGRTAEEAHLGNVVPVERLLSACRLLHPPPRLVQIGTVHEYGTVPHGTSIHENTVPAPQSVYGVAKLAASELVLDAIRAGEVSGAVVRIVNTYGPYPAGNTFMFSLTAKLHALDPVVGMDLTVVEAQRDYLDKRDAVDAVLRIAGNPAADPLVNVGSGAATGMHTIVAALVRAAGLPAAAVRLHAGEVDSLGGDWTRCDTTRIRALGWRPRHSLEQSMRDMWESLRTPLFTG